MPFIISFLFIKNIEDLDYGLWILYFQIVIIFSATIVSPTQLFFNREYDNYKNDKINLYNTNLIILILIMSLFSFLLFGNAIFLHSFLGLLTILTLSLNNLFFNYLRFKGLNFKYFYNSLIRTLLFTCLLLLFLLIKKSIQIEDLFIAYILSNLIIIFFYSKKLSICFKSYRLSEFLRLSIYGILTMSLGGIDKLVLIKTDLTVKDLAILGYALVFANSTSVIVEGFKKYFSPIYFSDFKKNNFFSKSTIKETVKANIILCILQIIFPFFIYFLIDSFGLIKESLISSYFFKLLFLLSSALFINNLYHFLNPFLFFKDKSLYLSLVILLTALIFIFLVFNVNNLDLIKLALLKIIASVILIISTIFLVLYFRSKKNA